MTVLQMAKREEEKLVTVYSLKESQIQRSITDLLAAERLHFMRLNTGGGLDSRGVPVRSHSGGKGVADILVILPSAEDSRLKRILWIEVKRPGNKQSFEQTCFQQHVEELGEYYLLAYSLDDVLSWLRKYEAVS
jgi:hypothetical protein